MTLNDEELLMLLVEVREVLIVDRLVLTLLLLRVLLFTAVVAAVTADDVDDEDINFDLWF